MRVGLQNESWLSKPTDWEIHWVHKQQIKANVWRWRAAGEQVSSNKQYGSRGQQHIERQLPTLCSFMLGDVGNNNTRCGIDVADLPVIITSGENKPSGLGQLSPLKFQVVWA